MSWLTEYIIFIWLIPVALNLILPMVVLFVWTIDYAIRPGRRHTVKKEAEKLHINEEPSLSATSN
ncbi:hypothetical protein [Desulfosediminicola flagellatus]|uniref:hypothetical protein n=1 Tax=Desulfosediminicola flagellatus TaxID=2569541 RepID=UPI0010AC3480|nr:hypothetical protein [Desulfosediminicola flagellatus]